MAELQQMFVHFNGTKETFISAGHPATYTDYIVFIKGDASGNGSCIYTHGTYFANFAELIAAINYVKGIKVGEDTYNAAAGGGYLAFEALDPTTIGVNIGQNGIQIGLTEAFVKKVNDTATNLGTKDDAADKDGSAFARIANLAALVSDLTGGSTESVAGQITTAINALRTEIVGTLGEGDAETLAAINDELDTLQSSLTTLGNRVKATEDAIGVLNGTGEGSVQKQVSDAIAGVVASAPEDFDTLKEIADYIASDKTGAAELNNKISANTTAIEKLNGDASTAGSVDKKVKDAIDTEVLRADDAYATKAQGVKADTAYQKPSTGIPASDLAGAVQDSLKKADAAMDEDAVVAKINEANAWIEL